MKKKKMNEQASLLLTRFFAPLWALPFSSLAYFLASPSEIPNLAGQSGKKDEQRKADFKLYGNHIMKRHGLSSAGSSLGYVDDFHTQFFFSSKQSSFQNYPHPDDHTRNTNTHRFKPFTIPFYQPSVFSLFIISNSLLDQSFAVASY